MPKAVDPSTVTVSARFPRHVERELAAWCEAQFAKTTRSAAVVAFVAQALEQQRKGRRAR